ncbi:hypothetical protein [Nocardia beijingensis]
MPPPRLIPSHGATPQNRLDARNIYNTVAGELTSVRAMADNWRKGIAGLLVAALGFSLIRGRSDLDRLDQGWAIAVAVLLGVTLLIGGFAAHQILSAAYGGLKPVPILPGTRSDGRDRPPMTQHELAMKALAALRLGMLATVCAATVLAAAVAITWFGPSKQAPHLSIIDRQGNSWCGAVKDSADGTVTLQTSNGTITKALTDLSRIRSLDTCPPTK